MCRRRVSCIVFVPHTLSEASTGIGIYASLTFVQRGITSLSQTVSRNDVPFPPLFRSNETHLHLVAPIIIFKNSTLADFIHQNESSTW